jgi:hypothetical protein
MRYLPASNVTFASPPRGRCHFLHALSDHGNTDRGERPCGKANTEL